MTAAAAVELDGYPFAPKTVEVNGHVMSYVDEGDPDAPPVLLVHGNPTWSFYYRSLLRSLPGLGRRVIAPDHIGMGRSDKPALDDYPHTLARRVEDLTAFVDALGLRRPISLVVHDWGGPIGLSWAADHPGAVDRIVVLNTGAFPLPDDHGLPWMLRAARLPGGERRARAAPQRVLARRPRDGHRAEVAARARRAAGCSRPTPARRTASPSTPSCRTSRSDRTTRRTRCSSGSTSASPCSTRSRCRCTGG